MNWRYRHTVLVLTTLAFVTTMEVRLALSAVVPLITSDFGVSNGVIGLALTGMWAAYAVMQFPSGVLGDRYGQRPVILAAVGLTVLAGLLIAASPGLLTFSLFVIVLGGGAGLHYTAGTTILTDLFDDVGRAVGVHVSGGPLAGMVAPPLAAAIGSVYGWRVAVLLAAAAGVPVFVLYAWRVRPTPPKQPDRAMRDRFEPGPILTLLRRPDIAFTTVIAVLGAFSWQATASFLPTFFADGEGLSATVGGGLFALYFVVHGVLAPVTGWLSDRLGRDAVATMTMGAGVVGYGGLVLADSLVWYVPAVAVTGFAMSWGAPVQSRFLDVLSPEEQNVGFGIVRTTYMTLGATGAVVVGVLADVAGWNAAIGLLGVTTGVAMLLLLGNGIVGFESGARG